MVPHPPPRRLLILACSATKRDDPTYMPAIERYDGPLWRTLRAADTPIETYDARMTPEIAERMKAGGLGTRWPRPTSRRNVMPAGQHPGMHIAPLSDWRRQPFIDVALVGGQLYLDVMRHFVGLFRHGGYVAADATITEINGPIGQMRQDLRR